MAALQGARVESQGKRNVKVSKCQRPKRCCALEPVLEHCELADSNPQQCSQAAQNVMSQKLNIPLRILSKLRDGYVKLMNEMASSADLSGASTFYGATGPGTDYRASNMVVTSSGRPTSVS
ncbi:hypothetical protein KC19_9G047700 [Ceratodon purpureus]|uniref:Uncharacterized protein n=1 Tax=Ceratodon purpureus TaxID=3225 RepID=A0A8T0GS30_CERPU|nr:hypothetical protein KC19_9G047700 [Ceratodon purpureus]